MSQGIYRKKLSAGFKVPAQTPQLFCDKCSCPMRTFSLDVMEHSLSVCSHLGYVVRPCLKQNKEENIFLFENMRLGTIWSLSLKHLMEL